MCLNSIKETCFSQKYQKWICLIWELNSSIIECFHVTSWLFSNMAAFIAMEINIHLCKHLFIYIIVRKVLHSWFKRMMIVCAHGACDCPGYPGQSVQSDGHVGGQHDVSENALYHRGHFIESSSEINSGRMATSMTTTGILLPD